MSRLWKPCRFADLIPDRAFSLRGLAPENGAGTLEQAYRDGYCGSFLTSDTGPLGSAARWYRDQFRETAGKLSYHVADALDRFGKQAEASTEHGYVASADAFPAWKRDRAQDAEDWLFQFQQNSGNCVGASWTEMLQGIAGTRAMDPANAESMSYLASMWVYAWRGYCGAGWYGSACAQMTIEHGYCFAFPQILNKYNYGGEQDGEDWTVSRWCRGGPPDDICDWVDSHGWRFDSGAISEMDQEVESLKAVARLKGQFHHGSNTTSGSHKPNVFSRIGGHQQTCFGVSWHPLLFDFMEAKGFKIDRATDAWTFNHQTWGSGFSGECGSEYWPYGYDATRMYSLNEVGAMSATQRDSLTLLAGEKPQGAWIVSASGMLSRVEGYAYLPKFKGLPGSPTPPVPPPPADDITLTANDLRPVTWSPMRGSLTVKAGEKFKDFILVPDGRGGYRAIPRGS